jgi:hypothetical protein
MFRSCKSFLLMFLATCSLPLTGASHSFAQTEPPATFGTGRWAAPRRQPLAAQTVSATGAAASRIPNRSPGGHTMPAGSVSDDGPQSLPNSHGQVWREYDIRGITLHSGAGSVPGTRPEQAVVDWILRETGTDVWFGEPLGLLSANSQTLRVYHTPEIQTQVADIIDRFTQSDAGKQAFSVRLVTLASPNWRAKALPRLVPVNVQSPGVEAWLMSREDAAMVFEQIRKRIDFRAYSSPNQLIQNGQTHLIERRRPMSYIKGMRAGATSTGGYQMELGQVNEGFSLSVSPLLSQDGAMIDAVIKLETTQIEKMSSMALPTPTIANPRQTSQIQVPQTSSWRLHERFRWPSNQVLLISCGMIAAPGPQRNGMLGLPTLPGKPARADALLLVEAKGRFDNLISAPKTAESTNGLNFRGRY